MLLSSHKEMKVKLDQIAASASLPEEELNTQKKDLLYKMFIRNLSKCIGRGALLVGTQQTTPTETLSIPKISLTGRIIHGNEESTLGVDFPKEEQGQTKERDAHV